MRILNKQKIYLKLRVYLLIQAMRFRVPRQVSLVVTSVQILQMLCGLGVALAVAVVKTTSTYHGGECHQSYVNVAVTLAMYISYLVLFLRFFYRAYARPTPRVGMSKSSTHENGISVQNDGKKLE